MYKYIFITYSALYSGNLAMNWILLDYWLLFPICSPLIHSINLLWYDHWEVMTFLLVVWYKDLFQFYTVLEYGACSLKFLEHLIMLNTPPSWPLFSLPVFLSWAGLWALGSVQTHVQSLLCHFVILWLRKQSLHLLCLYLLIHPAGMTLLPISHSFRGWGWNEIIYVNNELWLSLLSSLQLCPLSRSLNLCLRHLSQDLVFQIKSFPVALLTPLCEWE